MVYRGTWGRDPEKKGEDVFPFLVVFIGPTVLVPGMKTTVFRRPLWGHIFVEIADFRGIPPRMYYRLVPRLLPS